MSKSRDSNRKGRTKPRVWKLTKKQQYAFEVVDATLNAAHQLAVRGIIAEMDIPHDLHVNFNGESFTEVVGD